jgi:hypothetical protein
MSYLSLEERRKMVLHRLSTGENDYTVSALEQSLDSVGITAAITEQPGEKQITVTVTKASRVQPETKAAVRERAALVLPAHLTVTYDFSNVPSLRGD